MIDIWRMYPNGEVKKQTHVLHQHIADGQLCTGYDGNVEAWSEYNKRWRPGCAQIVRRNGGKPEMIYNLTVDQALLDEFINKEK